MAWGWGSSSRDYGSKEYWKKEAEEAQERLQKFKEDIYEKQLIKDLNSRIQQLDTAQEVHRARNEVLERTNQMLANVMHVEVAKVTHKK